jgi:translation initiation factor 3 subunit M
MYDRPLLYFSNHSLVNLFLRLSNLFNATPRQSALRLLVYNSLLHVATFNHELEVLGLSRTDVERWLKEWQVSPEQKSAFLKSIADAFAKAGQP